MGDAYVFIDESGDLGERGSDHFVLAAVIARDPAEFDRIIKNARRNKFKRQLRNASEIKANSSSNELREWVLRKWTETTNPIVQFVFLDKKKTYSRFLKDHKHKFYNYVCGQLASIMELTQSHLVIRIDKSKGKQALRDDFDQYMLSKLKERKWNLNVEIFHSYSESWSGLQIADMLAWAALRREQGDSQFFDVIEDHASVQRMWN